MIKDIQLKDFIAHKDTKLEFCKGITIFIGHNGSGKSSIIDAVTFALFGKHTRKSNRNLVRRGANSAMVQLNFLLNSKEFKASRALSGSGSQSFSQFSVVVSDGDGGKTINKPIIGGERKQFGESMSGELEKEIERLEPIIQRTQELQNREKLLIRHVNEKRDLLTSEVARIERIVRE